MMWDFFYAFLSALWGALQLSAPYLLGGLFISGIVHEWANMERIRSSLGKNSLLHVLKATLIGIPLPLCSCSVIPTGITLKKSGASNAATSSFLVATPESGLDSMAITYAMMDGVMTISRVVTAFFSALTAGILQIFFNSNSNSNSRSSLDSAPSPLCSSMKKDMKKEGEGQKRSLKERAYGAFSYSFGDLIDDMALWLLIGLSLGAIIEVSLPPNFFESWGGWSSRLGILLVGIPIYVCASAMTPIAASLVLKGMSPGSALLLLMVGPATNLSNILVLQKHIGKKGILLNIAAITATALLAAWIVDELYLWGEWSLDFSLGDNGPAHHGGEGGGVGPWGKALCAILMGGLILKGTYRELVKKVWRKDRG